MQQGMRLVRQRIAGEKRNMPTADRRQALEEGVSVLLVAVPYHKGSHESPCRYESEPHPGIAIQREHFLGRGQLRFFLTHKAPQFVHVALGEMSGMAQRGRHRPTMPPGSIQPVTDSIRIELDDAAGAPESIPFGQSPHRDGVMRLLCTDPEVRRPLTRRKGALTPGTPQPRNAAVGPTMDQRSAEAALTIVRALEVWTVTGGEVPGFLLMQTVCCASGVSRERSR